MKTLKLILAFLTLFAAAYSQTPATVSLSYAVVNVGASTNTLSPAMIPTVTLTLQPYFLATANNITLPVKFGNSIDVLWQTADTQSISIADVNGNPIWTTRAQIAVGVATIAQQQLIIALTPPAPPSP